jgi:hypothetical protein
MSKDGDGDYEVGYGRPPKHTQFKRGESRKRKKPANEIMNPGAEELNFAEAIIGESKRKRAVTMNGKKSSLTSFQLVFRKIEQKAIEGRIGSQRNYMDVLWMAHRIRAQHEHSVAERLTRHKDNATRAIMLEGIFETGETPFPHPDDVIANEFTNEYGIDGPASEAQKLDHDHCIATRDNAQAKVNFYARAWQEASSPEEREEQLKLWGMFQWLFDYCNDRLGKRYRTELKNRLPDEEDLNDE